MGISVRALLREKGTPYAELGLADPKWSDDQLLDFMLGGWYGAKITNMRGYMTNTDAPDYAKAHGDEFKGDEAAKVTSITENVRKKFAKGGG